jgi:hypothetical protein
MPYILRQPQANFATAKFEINKKICKIKIVSFGKSRVKHFAKKVTGNKTKTLAVDGELFLQLR